MVYAYALGGNTWSIKMTQSTTGETEVRVDNGVKNALALLQVNRQIYAEAHLFPYLYDTFAGRHNGHLREWVKSLPDAHRRSITAIRRYQRGYIVQGLKGQGLSVNPVFWMDMPHMTELGLDGLKQIEIEVALQNWGWDTNQEEMNKVIVEAMVKLRKLVEENHPGVVVDVFLRRGY